VATRLVRAMAHGGQPAQAAGHGHGHAQLWRKRQPPFGVDQGRAGSSDEARAGQGQEGGVHPGGGPGSARGGWPGVQGAAAQPNHWEEQREASDGDDCVQYAARPQVGQPQPCGHGEGGPAELCCLQEGLARPTGAFAATYATGVICAHWAVGSGDKGV
jgi:hypothetical protein